MDISKSNKHYTNISSRILLVTLIIFCCPLKLSASETPADFTDAESLMKYIDRLWRSDSSHAVLTMTVKTRRYQRSMKMESWSSGKERSLILIRSPKKDRGIATLKVDENIWNYLPKIKRVTKVPASLMSGSWMGSHFTNDDLVKENTFEDDYDSHFSFQGIKDGKDIIQIDSVPKADAAVVWGKVITRIDKKTLTPMNAVFFDEDNIKIRTIYYENLTQLNNKTIPMLMRVVPEDKPNESTTLDYESINFDVPLKKNLFSLKNLQKRR